MKIDGKLVVCYKAEEIKLLNYPGIEQDRYYIDTYGSIIDTKNKKNKNGEYYIKQESFDRNNLKIVNLNTINGRSNVFRVSKLVGYTFAADPEGIDLSLQTDFLDKDKNNTHYSNIVWRSKKDRIRIAYNNKTLRIANYRTDEEINRLCQILQNEPTIGSYEACVKAGIENITKQSANKLCSNIFHKKAWTHISDNYDFSNKVQTRIVYNDEVMNIIRYMHSRGCTWDQICPIIYKKPFKDLSIDNIRIFRKHYRQVVDAE